MGILVPRNTGVPPRISGSLMITPIRELDHGGRGTLIERDKNRTLKTAGMRPQRPFSELRRCHRPSFSAIRLTPRSPQSETEFSMFDTGQLDQDVFRVNVLEALRTSALRDGDGCNALVMPTFAEFSSDSSLSHIRPSATFAEYLPNAETTNFIQSSTFTNWFAYGQDVETNWGQYSSVSVEQVAHEGRFTLIQVPSSSVEYFPQ